MAADQRQTPEPAKRVIVLSIVVAVPAIHALFETKTWMLATSAGMTKPLASA